MSSARPMTSGVDTARMRAADEAIRDGRAGRIPMPEMLRLLLAAQVAVPLAGEPVLDGDRIVRWKPATLTKRSDGSQYVLAFTSEALVADFSKANPAYSFGFLVDTAWLIAALPPEHGVALNVGGSNGFEWSVTGIAAFMASRNAS